MERAFRDPEVKVNSTEISPSGECCLKEATNLVPVQDSEIYEMTSRGNQSVSPPAQLSQQRHVNVISSGTPPPQPYYSGSTSAVPQAAVDYYPVQGLVYYQGVPSYGSSINEIRGQPGNGGRAGPLPQSLPQGGSYYQQHGPSLRPQQIQQAPATNQQSYLGTQQAGPYCQLRPAQPSSQYYQNFQTPSMFPSPAPTVPIYPHAPFMQGTAYQPSVMCYPNGTQWRNPGMAATGASYIRPPQTREKKVLSITDPDTGRNITEEILSHKLHSAEQDDTYEQPQPVNQNTRDICQTFTRLVADRMKSPEEPGLVGPLQDSQVPIGGAPAPGQQQYQQLPPQQQMQQPPAKGPAAMMRPPMNGPPPTLSHQGMPARGGLNQHPPASVTPPQEIHPQVLGVNFSMPPPQFPIRPANQPVYNPAPQQLQHAAHPMPPHLPQTPPHQQPQSQPGRQHMPPTMPALPLQQVLQQPTQSPHHLPSHQPLTGQIPPHVAQNQSLSYSQQQGPSSGMATHPGTQPVHKMDIDMPKRPADTIPQNNIPGKMSTSPVSSPVAKTAPAVKELSPVTPVTDQAGDIKSPPPLTKTVASFRDEQAVDRTVEDNNKEDLSQGANTQALKDGRKSKKGLKGLNRKAVSGSDMDAFIDSVDEIPVEEAGESKNNRPASVPSNQETPIDLAVNNVGAQGKPARQASMEERETRPAADVGKGLEVFDARSARKDSSPTKKESTPSQKESTPSQKESTPSQKESTPSQKESTPSQKESTPSQKESTPTHKVSAPMPDLVTSVTSDNGYSKDKDSSLKHQDSHKPAAAPSQAESKYKQKKAHKKKKGHHSPPNQKSKQNSPSNDTSEKSNSVEAEAKSSHAPPAVASSQDTKSEVAPPRDSPNGMSVQDLPTLQPVTQQSEIPACPQQSPPCQLSRESSPSPPHPEAVDHTQSSPDENSEVKEASPTSDSVISTSKLDSARNQNQVSERSMKNVQTSRVTEHLNPPLQTKVHEEVCAETVDIKDSSLSDSAHRGSDGSESQDADLRPDAGDNRKEQVSDMDSENISLRPSVEKTVNKSRKGGRLQYDSAYLLELRDCPSSQAKPKGLPDLPEIILDLPLASMSRAATLDFTPAFFQSSGSMRNPPIGSTNSRNRQRPDLLMPQRVIKTVSIQDSGKSLHQSEKPWKPNTKQLLAGEVAEKKKTLESEVLFIMNRLTPTNFERLAEEMQNLDIKTYEDLQELVRIFFDKVTIETKFVEAYAQLCKVMSPLKVAPPPNSNIKESQAIFRVVMLTKCQQEFEADKTTIFEDPEEKRRKMEMELPEGPERDTKIENTLYHMKMRRLKFYGNIRFIGELFKLGMLTENIMHDCISRLLKAKDDDSLLSLCNLVTTVGQALDTDKSKAKMDGYFQQMARIAEERKSRIKFTLKDVIDLRNNNWVPRKEQTGPKKIDEVHKDFQQEQATKQFLQSQPLPPRTEPAPPSNRRANRQRQDEKQVSDDGWNTVGTKPQRIDASKMRLSKNVVDENNIQLGPGGGMKQFSMWSRGSYGGAQPSTDNDRPATNRFSALRGEEDRRSYQRSPSRGDGVVPPGRGTRQGPTAGHGRGKMLTRSSQEGERRDSAGRPASSSRDNSWNREDRRQPLVARGSREGENVMSRSTGSLRPGGSATPPAMVSSSSFGAAAASYADGQAVKRSKPLSEEEMEHKAKNILEEYLSAMDLEEAKLCVKELEGQAHISLLVTTSINDVLEKTFKERDLTGSFLHEIVQHGLLPLDVYLKGLSEVLSFAEDMVIDIPKIWTYLAQIIVPMLVGGSLSWPTLASTLKANLERRCCARLVAEILLIAKEKTNDREVAQMWQRSNMNWTMFLNAEEVSQFLSDKKLQFTVERTADSPPPNQRLMEDVEAIIRRSGSNNEIYAYVDKHAVAADKQSKHFIRSIVTAVVNASIIPTTKKLNEDILKSRKEVLHRYIRNKADLELQALYAIQALMHKLEHPSGVITGIFSTLFEEEIISEDTFKQWEKSSDPQEAEGKGACLMQLMQFFTWLRENEDPETS